MRNNNILCYFLMSIILILINSCQPEEYPSGEFPPFEVISAKEIYLEALNLAKAWSENAKLHKIDVPISRGSNTSFSNEEIYLGFVTTDKIEEYLFIICGKDGCYSEIYGMLYENITPFDFNEIKIDSIEAVNIALTNGGDEYIQGPDWFGRMSLFWSKEGSLEWMVLFHQDSDFLGVYIDPFTGEVIKIDHW